MRCTCVLILVFAACGRGPTTPVCQETGRVELAFHSFEPGDDGVSLHGGVFIELDGSAVHGAHVLEIVEGHTGMARTVSPVTAQSDRVALGFHLRNVSDSGAGDLAVRISTDAGRTFRDSTVPPPTLFQRRNEWMYTEVPFDLAADETNVIFEIDIGEPYMS